MIITDKKKLATVILSRMKDGKSSEMPVRPEEPMEPQDEDAKMIASDIMQAINDKSIQGLTEAILSLKAMFCDDGKEQDAESEGE